jgi:hypothetical protein
MTNIDAAHPHVEQKSVLSTDARRFSQARNYPFHELVLVYRDPNTSCPKLRVHPLRHFQLDLQTQDVPGRISSNPRSLLPTAGCP